MTGKSYFEYCMHYINHIIPCLIPLVDFILNRVAYKIRHLSIIIAWLLVYGVNNVIWCFALGHPIYKPIDPTKPIAYLYAIVLPLLTSLVYIIYEFI